MSIKEKLTTIAENVPKVYNNGYNAGVEAGKQAEYDAFWDAYQTGSTRTHYAYAFAYGWNDDCYNPKYPIVPINASGITCIFTWSQGISDTKVPITAKNNCSSAFANTKIIRIPRLIFDGATNVNNMFLNAGNLEELYCEGTLDIDGLNLQYSTKLTKASIESIVKILDTTTSGLTITLSKTAVDKAFETSEGANDGSTSAEWQALIGTKSNWTISLI